MLLFCFVSRPCTIPSRPSRVFAKVVTDLDITRMTIATELTRRLGIKGTIIPLEGARANPAKDTVTKLF